uniref:Uncharacterized protein n=1 Tax=Caenorhabditis japonica TaxID=281687 RepID=A0A8R1DT72_CAEJA
MVSTRGLTTKYAPCNTEICSYPAQRTCCIPYLPMLINGTMQCGPFPRETTVGTGPCCPGSGLWSEWTSFAKDENSGSYKKTRQCVSSSAGCGCTGSAVQSQAQCPCARTLKNADVCAEKDASIGKTFNMRLHRDLAITDINCTATLMLEANNDNVTSGGPEMCHSLNNYDYVPAIVLLLPSVETRGPSNKCYMDRPLNCNNRVATVKDLPVSFTCDLETLFWRYDYLGWFVEGYNQPAFKVT